ncbi:non-canonical purine NTP pyrophosphatase [Aeoliella mucimassa]|uniref:dITP/XTP pyrophosphatase n=1 Tax=Aeoliella mucimassa TaxID=2527972 RepID=A0A518AT30_9BACT|nr:non-canonical purine NTP pyrophosphatase [Aeoliella mucimassa]QDU57883.1 Non-canonical purine NTP pyrophosphatase [Aeoliella mucimassa]
MTPPLVIGTHNKKKGAELAEMLAPFHLSVATLADFANAIEVVEDGDSFAANARLKAVQQAQNLGAWVLADDSGIQIDALDGAPGIFSARFAGADATDDDNNRLLLEKLDGLPPERRGAQYYCHVTLADPTGEVRAETSATCRGVIRTKPSGTNGFGYDPLFEVREYHRTFGELGPAVKRALSHRSRAMRAIVPRIVALLGESAQ